MNFSPTAAAAVAILGSLGSSQSLVPDPPQLDGQKFRITVLEQAGYVDVSGDKRNRSFSGYCIKFLEALSRPDRANFQYELLTPSGTGSLGCVPRLSKNATNDGGGDTGDSDTLYGDSYLSQFNCGQSDVNDLPRDDFSTDMYLSSFYVTPERQLANQFTMPYTPPSTGTLAMYGTATGIANIDELVKKQEAGEQGPACVGQSQAYVTFLKNIHPTIQVTEVSSNSDEGMYDAIVDGICDVWIMDYPIATRFVFDRSRKGQCTHDGKPFGVIGEPLGHGLNEYAIGVGNHIPPETVRVLSYWLNVLMTCSPGDPLGECPEDEGGNLNQMYSGEGGTGRECGYVLYPPTESQGKAPIIGIVGGVVAALAIVLCLIQRYRHTQQEKRIRKRFLQQVARNISIGDSPKKISPGDLTKEIKYISSSGDGRIFKADLKAWLNDEKLGKVDDKDFEVLWTAMNTSKDGSVDMTEFCVYLSCCGDAFGERYAAMKNLSKDQRLKLASQRLSEMVAADIAVACEEKNSQQSAMTHRDNSQKSALSL